MEGKEGNEDEMAFTLRPRGKKGGLKLGKSKKGLPNAEKGTIWEKKNTEFSNLDLIEWVKFDFSNGGLSK